MNFKQLALRFFVAVGATSVYSLPAMAQDYPVSRAALLKDWGTTGMGQVGKKSFLVIVKLSGNTEPSIISKPSHAAFVVDSNVFYNDMSKTDLTKAPEKIVPIPLPEVGANKGLLLVSGCTFGKQKNIVLIKETSADKKNAIREKPIAAWMLSDGLDIVEVTAITKLKCPVSDPAY